MSTRFIVMDGKALDPEAVIAVTQNPDGHSFVGLTSGRARAHCKANREQKLEYARIYHANKRAERSAQ